MEHEMRRHWCICEKCSHCKRYFCRFEEYYCDIDRPGAALTVDRLRKISEWRKADVPEDCTMMTEHMIYELNHKGRRK